MVLISTLPLPQRVFTGSSLQQQHYFAPPLHSSRFKPCCCSSSHANHRNQAFSLIQDSAVIACLRANSAEQAMEGAQAAVDGGIEVVLKTLVEEYPTKAFGVGTILNAKDAKTAINAGVKFLMSPATVKDIIDDVQDADVLYIPGVMTPTEILSAYNAGAKIVKEGNILW